MSPLTITKGAVQACETDDVLESGKFTFIRRFRQWSSWNDCLLPEPLPEDFGTIADISQEAAQPHDAFPGLLHELLCSRRLVSELNYILQAPKTFHQPRTQELVAARRPAACHSGFPKAVSLKRIEQWPEEPPGELATVLHALAQRSR